MSVNTSSESIKMSATVKTTKKSAAAKPEPVAVAAPVVEAAPSKKGGKKAAKAEEVPAPVVAAPVVAAPVAPAVTSDVPEEELDVQLQKNLTSLLEQLTNLKNEVSTAIQQVKTVEKQAARVIKKSGGKRKRKQGDDEASKNCYFKKPLAVTPELCAFLGKDKGALLPRSDVTKDVIAYAKAHNLMTKQSISPDAALRKLLGVTEADNLTIMNLQRFLNKHYLKAEAATA